MKKEFALSLIIGLIFLSLGFGLLHYGLIGYGVSFFVFLPFTLGYLLGKSAFKQASLFGLIASIIIFFFMLFTGNLEGMVCILMALPIIGFAVAVGVAVKHFTKKYTKKDKLVKSSILPFCLFVLFGVTEHQLTKSDKHVISIKSEIDLP